MHAATRFGLGLLVLATATAAPCPAQVPARALTEALKGAGFESPVPAAPGSARGLGVLLESETPIDSAVLVADGLYFVRRSVGELAHVLSSYPGARATWSPPLRTLLDQAGEWVAAPEARAETGLTGAGVYVGVVDTGFDIRHPDLRQADGSTRVGWMIDFSQGPAGSHPALEEQYGCTLPDLPCRILSREDLDELLDNSMVGDEPDDRRGHGTHVSSLAAGNGLSQSEPAYVGMAPEATLALAQVLGPEGSIDEASVLLGTRFIFERAREESRAAAVNISLGTDFGAHDGSSVIERKLASFVGSNEPGRALVVAAGNSGAQAVGLTKEYPGPLGIHTEVHVAAHTQTRVPLLTLSRDAVTFGGLFAWIEARPGDFLRLGFDDGRGDDVRWVEPGDSRAFAYTDSDSDFQVTLVNSPSEADTGLGVGRGSAAVVVSGQWSQGRAFVLHLEGHGSAQLWVEGTGALTSGSGGGVFLPRSSKEGTITIPASHPDLIAVGATVNRKDWPSESDEAHNDSPALDVPLDSVAYFSSAGPNSLGHPKPDVVAPGAYVIGAMSRDADPRTAPFSIFASASCDDPGCRVVDAYHAVGAGTSMAAPLVTGAAALLMQRNPGLTSTALRHLLMAGSRRPTGQVPEEQQQGAGRLDILESLRVQDRVESGGGLDRAPTREQTRLVLGSSFVHPDPNWPLTAHLLLRDADDEVTDPPRSALRVTASGAVDASLVRLAPGLWQLVLSAASDAGGKTLPVRVYYEGELIAARDVPIGVDRATAHSGFSARGGCSVALAPSSPESMPWWGAFGLLEVIRRRKRFRNA